MMNAHGSRTIVGLMLVGGLVLTTTGCTARSDERVEGSTAAVSADPGTADEVTIYRSYSPGRGHFVTTGSVPDGTYAEWSFVIRLNGDSHPLFLCAVGSHGMASNDPNCEGQPMHSFLGWASNNASGTRTPLYRCRVGGGEDHFVSVDGGCEGHILEGGIGFVERATALPPPPPPPPWMTGGPTSGA